jgi:hypothetical protein
MGNEQNGYCVENLYYELIKMRFSSKVSWNFKAVCLSVFVVKCQKSKLIKPEQHNHLNQNL